MSNIELKDIIGVIFDFNGTMFFDSEKHVKAWAEYVCELTGVTLTGKDINTYIRGCSGKEALEHFLGYEISKDMMEQFSEEKEGIYRRLCMEDKKNLALAPGLEKFLDFLAEHNIPRTMASTASLGNMMYYFEIFDLYRWFDPDKVVFHDSRLRDKPYPDMYQLACQLIKLSPEKCLVFEDSTVGITAAENAGIKHIIAVTGDNPLLNVDGYSYVDGTIKDFTELNEDFDIGKFQ